MRFRTSVQNAIPFVSTVAILLVIVEWKVDMPMLLLERFLPGWGWLEMVSPGNLCLISLQ